MTEWTAESRRLAIEMAGKVSIKEIAEMTGKSPGAVTAFYHRRGISAKQTGFWGDPEVQQALRECVEARMTYAQIAEHIGGRWQIDATRNAIAGAMKRAGLVSKSGKAGLTERARRAPKEHDRRRTTGHFLSINPGFDGGRPRTCEWPIGNPGDDGFHFCGAERDGERPYCAAHAKRAYRKVG